MPDALVDNRLGLDETSLDFRAIEMAELERQLDLLNETIRALRADGLAVRVHPWLWDSLECMDGLLLCDFVYQTGTSTVSPDTLRLLGVLLDKCPSWSEGEPGFADSVSSIDIVPEDPAGAGGTTRLHIDLAYSLGLALSAQRHMAFLTLTGTGRRGIWKVSGQGKASHTYFFTTATELCAFWRWLFAREKVKEHEFFALARHAYPALVFHPHLKFGAFDGSYQDVRDSVAGILGVVNDHFGTALIDHAGLPKDVQAALGAHGIELSPESPKTRSSTKLMAQRTVALDGTPYICEWHAKLEPHRNRIHFSLPIADLGGRILIGLFVEHLDT